MIQPTWLPNDPTPTIVNLGEMADATIAVLDKAHRASVLEAALRLPGNLPR